MANLKVGIIGLGGIARAHCDAIATLDNVEVVAVADLFEEKRRQYMDKYGISKGYPTHTDLLKPMTRSTQWPSCWAINSITASPSTPATPASMSSSKSRWRSASSSATT